MEFRLLGPVEAVDIVPAERLITVVWGEEPPQKNGSTRTWRWGRGLSCCLRS